MRVGESELELALSREALKVELRVLLLLVFFVTLLRFSEKLCVRLRSLNGDSEGQSGGLDESERVMKHRT